MMKIFEWFMDMFSGYPFYVVILAGFAFLSVRIYFALLLCCERRLAQMSE